MYFEGLKEELPNVWARKGNQGDTEGNGHGFQDNPMAASAHPVLQPWTAVEDQADGVERVHRTLREGLVPPPPPPTQRT